MTYIELITLIEKSREKVLADNSGEIITDKSHFVRGVDRQWVRDKVPGAPTHVYTRGGMTYIWKSEEQSK